MTSTAARTVKDQELMQYGLVESANVNSITNFAPSKVNKSEGTTEKEKEDYVNTFICHLIFYAVLCVSLVLHILVDLGLGSFIQKQFIKFIGFGKETVREKNPAFA